MRTENMAIHTECLPITKMSALERKSGPNPKKACGSVEFIGWRIVDLVIEAEPKKVR